MFAAPSFGLLFNVEEGGVSTPIEWSKESLTDDRSVIVLDESSQAIWLWHGVKQGLVARRTALRQAESLKGHGYTMGKIILGRDIRNIYEIDQRKIGRDPDTDKLNTEFQNVFNRKYKELDNFVVSFDVKEVIMPAPKPAVKEEIKPKAVPKPKPEPMPEPKLGPIIAPAVSKPTIPERKIQVASEYAAEEAMPSIKPKEKLEPTELVSKMQLVTDAKVAFVISGIIDHFADVWISKKEDGSFAVEEMNGPICNFAIREGGKINFKSGSFSGIDLKVKTAIQRKFIELTKLL
ncbi:MAG: hypothetical protein KAT66_06125 [Candidatus Lokiarchaeota archaeon]|nr:hypothetical protein [Candidatus Lokiarchaeota archaeon]